MSQDGYLRLIRGVVKLSSCLYDADEVATSRYNKFKLKSALATWIDQIELLSNDLTVELFTEKSIDETAIYNALNKIPDAINHHKLKEDMIHMLIMCGKLQSALNDFELSNLKYKEGVVYMYAYSYALLHKIQKQYSWCNGELFSVLYEYYDDLGDKLLITKNE